MVAEHPIGPRVEHRYPLRFDVPMEYFAEQPPEDLSRYVHKLAAIGADSSEVSVNRTHALLCASEIVGRLSREERQRLFAMAQELTGTDVRESDVDEYHRKTTHPLSRFRMSIGSQSELMGAAAMLMQRAATGSPEHSVVADIALRWIRCDDDHLQIRGGHPSYLSKREVRPRYLGRISLPS